VRRRHFERLKPVCPQCRARGTGAPALKVRLEARATEESIDEGMLACANGCEYPVVDGVPVIVPDVRAFLATRAQAVIAREDLSPAVAGLLADAVDADARQRLSGAVWDHYAEFDPLEETHEVWPGAVARLAHHGLQRANPRPDGPILDAGCGPGRGSFEVARRTGELVLGIDVDLPPLRLAQRVLRDRTVRYDRKRSGAIYDRREFTSKLEKLEQVDFWCCDGLALPFDDGTFAAAAALNVIDRVPAPADLLRSLRRVTRHGGKLILASAYDWTGRDAGAWLGGADGVTSESALRALLTPGQPGAIDGLVFETEDPDFPWHVRVHDRKTELYRLQVVTARVE
jgi:SAM-dependent methyltransferase